VQNETGERAGPAGGFRGKHGRAILEVMTDFPDATRAEIAARAGCSVGRVGEVVRALEEQGITAGRALVNVVTEAHFAESEELRGALWRIVVMVFDASAGKSPFIYDRKGRGVLPVDPAVRRRSAQVEQEPD
jgi:hypothetical protein